MPFKAKEVLRRLQRAGFEVRRQSGSHVVLRHNKWPANLCADAHWNVPTGTFQAILKQAGLSEDQFRDL
jgi:predicted RNA binding protein YcfA (HicA-like mRNA interferase family)